MKRIKKDEYILCWKVLDMYGDSDFLRRICKFPNHIFQFNKQFLENQFLTDNGKLIIQRIDKTYFEVIKKVSSFEFLMWQWLTFAKQKGYIDEFRYESETFVIQDTVEHYFTKEMKTKTKQNKKVIISEIKYTPDFYIKTTPKLKEEFPNFMDDLKLIPFNEDNEFYLDVKSKSNFGKNSSNASFPPKRAMLYNKEGIYVTKTTLDIKKNWFTYLFVPNEMAYMKDRKKLTLKKKFKNCKII